MNGCVAKYRAFITLCNFLLQFQVTIPPKYTSFVMCFVYETPFFNNTLTSCDSCVTHFFHSSYLVYSLFYVPYP